MILRNYVTRRSIRRVEGGREVGREGGRAGREGRLDVRKYSFSQEGPSMYGINYQLIVYGVLLVLMCSRVRIDK